MCDLRRSWKRVLVGYTGSCFHLIIYYEKQIRSENNWPVCQQMQTDRNRTLSKEVAIDHEICKEANEDLSKGVERMVKRSESWKSSGVE